MNRQQLIDEIKEDIKDVEFQNSYDISHYQQVIECLSHDEIEIQAVRKNLKLFEEENIRLKSELREYKSFMYSIHQLSGIKQ